MPERILVGGLSVAEPLYRFLLDEALPAARVDPAAFWAGAADLFADLGPRSHDLVAHRADLQQRIDRLHRAQAGPPDIAAYAGFLNEIGYLVDEPPPFEITTSGVDQEVSVQAGPQLVVPLLNARFAVNAANARWGSLYDALYGTDVISRSGALAPGAAYNPVRGAQVIARGRAFLDRHFPLVSAFHGEVTAYGMDRDGLTARVLDQTVRLADPGQLIGVRGKPTAPEAVVLRHHGLHAEIRIDRDHPIGAEDPAGVADLVLESAVSTIMDLEDSVAAVDAEDKVVGYRNWLQLMQGRLTAEVTKDGRTFTRTMSPDRTCTAPSGELLTLPGRALLFIRQVGLLMTTDAILDRDGHPVPEGMLDALVTALCTLPDLRGETSRRNSRTGSMYVVKPKLHGPDEVAFSSEVFARVEQILGLAPLTIKIGIMDEERRTSLNLKACIHAARDRIAFVNTGFLDRTGDEIRTSTYAGAMVPKQQMRGTPWIRAYEQSNVAIALATGFRGRAQIGKGMWAEPDSMAAMVDQKVAHPEAGASCAWVPSPTAATLHALHYHDVDVSQRQEQLAATAPPDREHLLTIPLGDGGWTADERQAELDNNVQGVLGYVVRWVDAGIGCSKVPDLEGTPLMEDRATCRISSQHVANWLLHGVVTTDEVQASLRRMAAVVDRQNASTLGYRPMAPAYDGTAFRAASALLLEALEQPSGYTEPILHRSRIEAKRGADS